MDFIYAADTYLDGNLKYILYSIFLNAYNLNKTQIKAFHLQGCEKN